MDSMDTPSSNELARRTMPIVPGRAMASRRGADSPNSDRPALKPQVILRGLKRYWWQAALLWIAGSMALASAIHLMVKPDYEASSLLRVELSSQELFDTSRPIDNRDSQLETQVELVTSANVLSAVMARPEIAAQPTVREAADAEAALRKVLNVQIIPRTQLIRVSAALPSPTEAATIVNAVVEAFLEADAEWASGMTRQQIENLKVYQTKLRAKVETLERDLLALAAKGNLDAVLLNDASKPVREASTGELFAPNSAQDETATTLHSVTIDEYKMARGRLLQIDMELTVAEAMLASPREEETTQAADFEVSQEQITEALQADPEIRAAYQELIAARDRMERVGKLIRKPSDPSAQQARRQLETQEADYRQLWEAKDRLLRQNLVAAQIARQEQDPAMAPVLAQRQIAEQRMVELRHNKARLEDWLGQVEVTNRQQSTDAVQSMFLNADWQQHRQMLQSVASRLEQLEFNAQGLRRIYLIDQARPPGGPLADRQRKYMAVAPVGMLGLVLMLTTLLELRAKRIAEPDDLSSRMALEVFTVPPLPMLSSSNRSRGGDPIELFVQQLDHLRVSLCGEMGHGGPGRCVLVTSATGGEGKTTLAAQLAVRCAEAGAATLLIDADLRRASLGKLFEVPECPGLSDVLRGDLPVEDALVPVSQVGGCQLLPAGSPEQNPGRVLQGHLIGPLLETLRQRFDVILIDTPPVLPVPDALVLGRRTDGAVLTTRHDQSRFPMVERAYQLLTSAGVPVLGVVINGVPPAQSHYGTYAYSYGPGRSAAGPAEH
ncbi:hypothetical protein BH23PLA1_BH23PLA1_00140 [soil metagenome]